MSASPPFTLFAAVAVVVLILAIGVGVVRWQQPGGKMIVFVAGGLLLLVVGVLAAVLFTVASGSMG